MREVPASERVRGAIKALERKDRELRQGMTAFVGTINGHYKTQIIERRGPQRSFEATESTKLDRGHWFNNRRLLEPIGKIPLAEAEERSYAKPNDQLIPKKTKPNDLQRTRGGSSQCSSKKRPRHRERTF